MPFISYTNAEELQLSNKLVRAARININDSELLEYNTFAVKLRPEYQPAVELHVYTTDGVHITGNHSVAYDIIRNNILPGNGPTEVVGVNVSKELEELGINRGQYKLLYNVFDNIVGSYTTEKLYIDEIASSRLEARVKLQPNRSSNALITQLIKLQQKLSLSKPTDIRRTFVLNFGLNSTVTVVNFRIENIFNPEIYVKFYQPLPADIEENAKFWISEQIIDSVVATFTIQDKEIPEEFNVLSGPNFELEQYDGDSFTTNYKSWSDLLGSNLPTSQKIVDSYFSGSLSGVKLNINYRLFDNFVHYSSATERVKNFHYKLQLIEGLTSRLLTLFQVNGGTTLQTNLIDVYNRRNAIVSNFDDFEKYLFFESTGSRLYTHYDSTGSIDPWPKQTPVTYTWSQAFFLWSNVSTTWQQGGGNPDPYGYFSNLVSTTSQTGQDYYLDLLEKAELYDRFNSHKLQNVVPIHLQSTDDADQFLLFVHMLGQHFDILWTYVKNLHTIYSREEHPKDGMPNDLLYHVASGLGFKLLNGKSASDLWKYTFGTDENGNVLQSDISKITSIPDSDHTKEIWRRIVNNLPYILKNKGTSRSIKALLSCFGIPSSVLVIKEYGGPTTYSTESDYYPEYIHDVYHYAFRTETGSLELPVKQYLNASNVIVPANTLEFRFKTDSNFNYGLGSYYNIISAPSASVNDVYHLTLTRETAGLDNEGTITLFNSITGNAVSASNLEIFDDSWHTIAITSENGTGSFKITRSKYSKFTYIKSSSFAGDLNIFPTTGTKIFTFASGSRALTVPVTLPDGSTVSNLSKFNGHFHEIRIWSGSLNDATLVEHAASPNTYTYNVDRINLTTGQEASKPYEHLFQRFTLANKQIESGSFYQNSVHPNQQINTGSIYYIGFANSGSINFEGYTETYYTPSPSLGGQSLFSSKIRIESSSLDETKTLNTKTRIERSSFDRYSLDSNRLGIYFSPQTAINEDIFNQLGYFEIDDYVGDTRDLFSENYPKLVSFSRNYWKKYDNRNDFESYFRALEIYDFTFFKYVRRLIPYRVNPILGLVIEPNVLERSKVRIMRNNPDIENLVKDMYIRVTDQNLITGEHNYIPSIIDVNDTINLVGQNPVTPNMEIDISRNSELEFSSEVLSNVDTAVIENIVDTNRLGSNWIENRYFENSTLNKITITGSFIPYDPRSIILNARLSNYLVDKDERYKILAFSGSVTTVSGAEIGRFNLPYPGTYYVSASFDDLNGDVRVQDTLTILDTIPQISAFSRTGSYDNEFRFNTNLIIFRNTGPNTVVTKQILIYRLNYSQTQDFIPRGTQNHRYLGSKLTASAVNVDTPVTVDGGPVVKITEVNPNKLVFSSNQLTTINKTVSGKKLKSK